MNRTLSVLVLGACSLLAAITLLHTNFAKHSLTVVADGVPPPPWPKLNDALLADGVPPPPWPTKVNGVLANSSIV